MDELLKKKRSAEAKISKLQDSVEASENKKLEEKDKLLLISRDKDSSQQEIACLEATEGWLDDKTTLAEAKVELARIELAISQNTEDDSRSPIILELQVVLAEAKVFHAEAAENRARTAEKLSEVRIKNAQNERERERCERVFANANKILKNASDNREIANDHLRMARVELEKSITDPDAMESSR
jgi:hypothetical protein